MPHHELDSTSLASALEVLADHGFDGMASAVAALMNEVMKLERAAFLQAAPYERSDERRGYANGFKPKRVATRVGALDLQVPQVRGVPDGGESFYPTSLERGVRSERALKLAVAEMYVQGVSTRRVAEITRDLCGLEVSSAQVSRATAALDLELHAWRNRPIGNIRYLILDARYEKVRHGGSVMNCAVLVAIGVREDGKRSILGASVKLSEAEVHWREFLGGLQDRGMHGVRLVISDSHEGLKAALRARMPNVPWQRCQFHLQQNAMHYVPKIGMRREVAEKLRVVFNAPDRPEAERRLADAVKAYEDSAPKLAEWMENNVPESFSVFLVPSEHRRMLRTTNVLERLNKEIKRRTRVATLFPNEASLLRLVSAVLTEISDEWETGRVYLTLQDG
jgi:transposase-like protein